ncbi:glycosyltransferase family 4 protein [Roseococcus suduntuyensis]|uniref:Glycosyltransferase involved in cell wall biosynthesis n=1 Tax=Roseococcus suduntuyensis TaxID=455361 RepID=A0A840AA25_9PROT|nr:glycosyltransferase family 1 protein [Roseococcus suduntuyensis]MBB3897035.1 glycosyltransferase involved in cell wall biosynthesis [Roseococcus suduntuyensis]
MHIVLDISRLLGLAWHGQPSGVDRVEIAHARHWRALPESRVTFVAQSPWGWFAALPDGFARSLLTEADAVVAPGKEGGLARFRAMAAAALSRRLWGGGRWALAQRLGQKKDSVFLVTSHRAVHKEGAIAGVVAAGARFVPMLHDLIPLGFPEYCRPHSTVQHAQRLRVISALAAGVITPTRHVALQFHTRLREAGLAQPPVQAVGLGLDLPNASIPMSETPRAAPYVVMVGTIEPRKNHLLALQMWRQFAREGQPGTPRLRIIGRRGWDNEDVFRMLERVDFGGLVEECGRLPDPEVARLVRGAAALLSPSFAEGYGIPVAEALACGTPVIASDIPPAREVGGHVPEFFHPLDFHGWSGAVRALAEPGNARRQAQLQRLAQWRTPTWSDHFRETERFLDRLCGREPRPEVQERALATLLQE